MTWLIDRPVTFRFGDDATFVGWSAPVAVAAFTMMLRQGAADGMSIHRVPGWRSTPDDDGIAFWQPLSFLYDGASKDRGLDATTKLLQSASLRLRVAGALSPDRATGVGGGQVNPWSGGVVADFEPGVVQAIEVERRAFGLPRDVLGSPAQAEALRAFNVDVSAVPMAARARSVVDITHALRRDTCVTDVVAELSGDAVNVCLATTLAADARGKLSVQTAVDTALEFLDGSSLTLKAAPLELPAALQGVTFGRQQPATAPVGVPAVAASSAHRSGPDTAVRDRTA